MLGATLGSYSIQRELGRGGMGAVYVGVHALLGRAAAIKVLLPQFSQNQEIVQRFFNEARAATAIRHPGIVEIYDFGFAADGAAFIVMELCDGESLAARLKRHGVLPVAQALATTRQIAGALAAAHKAGIVHRDLKPDNVFLVPDPEVASGERIKLLDFGIAKLAGEQPGMARTQTGALMGTPLYMSPEQCRGAGQVDHRSDLYALGCMLFEMLCGRVPFLGEGAGDIIGAHLLTAPPAPSSLAANIPPEVEALILHLLAKKAVDRPARAEDVVAALARLGAVAGYATDPTVSGSGGGGSGAAVAIAATMAPSQPGVPDTQPEPGSYPGPTPVTPAPVTPAPVTPAPAGVSSPPAPAGVSSPPAPAAAASYPPTPYGQAAPVAARGGHRGLWVASGSIAVAVAVGVTVSIVSQRRDRASAETERMGAELLAARAAIAAHDQPAAEAALARAVAAGADGTLTAPLRAELGPASPRVAVGSPDAPPARPTRAFVVGEVAIARGAQAAPDPGARILLRDRLAAVMPTAASSLDPASAGADAIPITATGSIRTSATAKGTRSTCAITLTAAPGGALIRGEAQTDWDTLPSEDLERDQRECLGSVIDSALRDAIIPKLP